MRCVCGVRRPCCFPFRLCRSVGRLGPQLPRRLRTHRVRLMDRAARPLLQSARKAERMTSGRSQHAAPGQWCGNAWRGDTLRCSLETRRRASTVGRRQRRPVVSATALAWLWFRSSRGAQAHFGEDASMMQQHCRGYMSPTASTRLEVEVGAPVQGGGTVKRAARTQRGSKLQSPSAHCFKM